MTIKNLKEIALDALIANPGSTRMEWFLHTFPSPEDRTDKWNTFKFQIALPLILGGRVHSVADPMNRGMDRFYPGGVG